MTYVVTDRGVAAAAAAAGRFDGSAPTFSADVTGAHLRGGKESLGMCNKCAKVYLHAALCECSAAAAAAAAKVSCFITLTPLQ